ncbi:hypothetical protein GCM10010525_12450 [Glutamicibacter bergerei]|uniref:Uncharacterized protein n=1 Tax=Glutamicibacter ardleyensis TaxID=225894 RepID=A0ABQ2DR66_9MICC|nr:hypothetical protein CIK74_04395 [Glutamicibacter sp. BW77]GGJ63639.1 hypothetical protein GCM10007173_23220 [Glutamicibacter ardleyensis]HBV10888.1 hypothetical protein [Micrococcaceae bacterium]
MASCSHSGANEDRAKPTDQVLSCAVVSDKFTGRARLKPVAISVTEDSEASNKGQAARTLLLKS